MHRFIFGLGNDHIYFVIFESITHGQHNDFLFQWIISEQCQSFVYNDRCFLSQCMCVCLMIIINHKVSRLTMNHTAFILGPTFTALCYNIVYNVVKSGEIQHLKLDISTTCVNIVLRENRYGLTFRSMSDLGLKKFMKQISLIITNIDRNRTFSRRIECLKLIWGLGMCSGKI